MQMRSASAQDSVDALPKRNFGLDLKLAAAACMRLVLAVVLFMIVVIGIQKLAAILNAKVIFAMPFSIAVLLGAGFGKYLRYAYWRFKEPKTL
jgi:hypothetical protein